MGTTQIRPAGAQHAAPGRQGLIDAETEKAQTRSRGDRPLPPLRRRKVRRPVQTLVAALIEGSRLARQAIVSDADRQRQRRPANPDRRSLYLARIRRTQVSESLPRRPHGSNAANLSDDRQLAKERIELNVIVVFILSLAISFNIA